MRPYRRSGWTRTRASCRNIMARQDCARPCTVLQHQNLSDPWIPSRFQRFTTHPPPPSCLCRSPPPRGPVTRAPSPAPAGLRAPAARPAAPSNTTVATWSSPAVLGERPVRSGRARNRCSGPGTERSSPGRSGRAPGGGASLDSALQPGGARSSPSAPPAARRPPGAPAFGAGPATGTRRKGTRRIGVGARVSVR